MTGTTRSGCSCRNGAPHPAGSRSGGAAAGRIRAAGRSPATASAPAAATGTSAAGRRTARGDGGRGRGRHAARRGARLVRRRHGRAGSGGRRTDRRPGRLYDNALFEDGRGHLLVYRPTADPPRSGRVHSATCRPSSWSSRRTWASTKTSTSPTARWVPGRWPTRWRWPARCGSRPGRPARHTRPRRPGGRRSTGRSPRGPALMVHPWSSFSRGPAHAGQPIS